LIAEFKVFWYPPLTAGLPHIEVKEGPTADGYLLIDLGN
jgi:hypothetical protein